MRTFLDADFLLHSDVAADLYHRVAADLPVIDFHCHLPPQLMAEDHRFRSITEIWLEGDHYKWRAMRTNGEPERCCSGDASDWEKFEAWARTVPDTLRSPLYHWTHMELRRPFGIQTLLSPATAREVFDRANARLQEDSFTAMGLLRQFRAAVVCTTDDPVDSLAFHDRLATRANPDTRVYPTWRPDRAFDVEQPAVLNAWLARLEQAAGTSVHTFNDLLVALDARHQAFHDRGCRLSDHGFETIVAEPWTDAGVVAAFDTVRRGLPIEPGDALRLKSALLYHLALMDHARGWVQQFHLGALRDTNSRLRQQVGRDAGVDSIGDFDMARPLARFFDSLDRDGRLAKTILYNLNPRDNELVATMIGNFQDGSVPGKMQYGPAWWFLDQLDGMERQLNALSNLGLLSRFVGMVTDSRSFLSYSRHEYFRRLLCEVIGRDVVAGVLPDDRELLARLVRNVCFVNAREYFGLPVGLAGTSVG